MKNKLQQSYLNRLSFSNERKRSVQSAIKEKQAMEWADFQTSSITAILYSLEQEAKDGFTISSALLSDSHSHFHHNEADIYTLLHLLEEKGWIEGQWDEETRRYQLTFRGRRTAAKLKEKSRSVHNQVKQLVRIHL
ncbi:helix-turn-helix transcriptional regulator [Alkalicoccus luteus]|uniref:helix-turn-helix transcriptional regulator n=1 Tax=Alkalicoccus luteus TaxID=1237094 RepID=UPI004034F705